GGFWPAPQQSIDFGGLSPSGRTLLRSSSENRAKLFNPFASMQVTSKTRLFGELLTCNFVLSMSIDVHSNLSFCNLLIPFIISLLFPKSDASSLSNSS